MRYDAKSCRASAADVTYDEIGGTAVVLTGRCPNAALRLSQGLRLGKR